MISGVDSFLFFPSKGNGDGCEKFIFTSQLYNETELSIISASTIRYQNFYLFYRRNILQPNYCKKIKIKNISEVLKPLNQEERNRRKTRSNMEGVGQ